ncbi:hypothetical protein PQU92_04400 [Asticcacaulis sp. BYS171W]|uniref:Uncharacterized protein n=1 Tax=Asticcacaulis aquaticus TaxID=2984212 RepID=A0ABT5HR10_9CAUL|nr:hypothetical protein [Asticcacaulis aquaticus]MDC7682503.1 hypothetical protein [Asticcacaulis aquaticus]
MILSRLSAVVFSAALLSGAASAHADSDEAVVTATRTRLPTEAEIAAAKADATTTPISLETRILDQVEALPVIERRIRTEMGVSIGTSGYRSGYVATEIPIGETGTLGIAIGQTDFGRNGVLVYDDYDYGYGGYGYGYGYDSYGAPYDGGYGRYGASYGPGYAYGPGYGYGRPRLMRGGKTQSIAISLDFSGDKTNSRSRKDCEGFYDGSRYIEPLWATQMRGPGKCATDEKP